MLRVLIKDLLEGIETNYCAGVSPFSLPIWLPEFFISPEKSISVDPYLPIFNMLRFSGDWYCFYINSWFYKNYAAHGHVLFAEEIQPRWQTHLVMCFWERAMAYSATTVLPADVCAATNTDSWASSLSMACFWKTSSSNGHWRRAEKQGPWAKAGQPLMLTQWVRETLIQQNKKQPDVYEKTHLERWVGDTFIEITTGRGYINEDGPLLAFLWVLFGLRFVFFSLFWWRWRWHRILRTEEDRFHCRWR